MFWLGRVLLIFFGLASASARFLSSFSNVPKHEATRRLHQVLRLNPPPPPPDFPPPPPWSTPPPDPFIVPPQPPLQIIISASPPPPSPEEEVAVGKAQVIPLHGEHHPPPPRGPTTKEDRVAANDLGMTNSQSNAVIAGSVIGATVAAGVLVCIIMLFLRRTTTHPIPNASWSDRVRSGVAAQNLPSFRSRSVKDDSMDVEGGTGAKNMSTGRQGSKKKVAPSGGKGEKNDKRRESDKRDKDTSSKNKGKEGAVDATPKLKSASSKKLGTLKASDTALGDTKGLAVTPKKGTPKVGDRTVGDPSFAHSSTPKKLSTPKSGEKVFNDAFAYTSTPKKGITPKAGDTPFADAFAYIGTPKKSGSLAEKQPSFGRDREGDPPISKDPSSDSDAGKTGLSKALSYALSNTLKDDPATPGKLTTPSKPFRAESPARSNSRREGGRGEGGLSASTSPNTSPGRSRSASRPRNGAAAALEAGIMSPPPELLLMHRSTSLERRDQSLNRISSRNASEGKGATDGSSDEGTDRVAKGFRASSVERRRTPQRSRSSRHAANGDHSGADQPLAAGEPGSAEKAKHRMERQHSSVERHRTPHRFHSSRERDSVAEHSGTEAHSDAATPDRLLEKQASRAERRAGSVERRATSVERHQSTARSRPGTKQQIDHPGTKQRGDESGTKQRGDKSVVKQRCDEPDAKQRGDGSGMDATQPSHPLFGEPGSGSSAARALQVSTEQLGRSPSIDKFRRWPSVDKPSVDKTGRSPSVDKYKRSPSLDKKGRSPSVDKFGRSASNGRRERPSRVDRGCSEINVGSARFKSPSRRQELADVINKPLSPRS